jgi:predicted SnoaL-like aldol condensation-catalyzing enzyme
MHGPSPTVEKEAIMDTARNKDLARRLYVLINEGRVDQVAGLISPDYTEHDPLPRQGSGREGAVDRFSMITTALAPHFTIEDLIAEGDRIVVRLTRAPMSASSPASPRPVGPSPSRASTSTASPTGSYSSTGM